jgi:hypothetical protein
MDRFVRTLLIWLLALAVPAQGATAATMAFCGPNHHRAGQAALSSPVGAAEHAHDERVEQTPHGHPAEAVQHDQESSASASNAAPATLAQADNHKCSACASCCSAGAILGADLVVPAPAVGRTEFVSVVPTVGAFAADRLDRPPRILLA